MRAVVQRVTEARVRVDDQVVGEIGAGLCVLVGVTHEDDEANAAALADKLWHLRVFDDDQGSMNRSVADTSRQILVVSQFTLYGDTRKGRRPSWQAAARPEQAAPLIEHLCRLLTERGAYLAKGVFGAEMDVELVNEGPVTLVLEV